MTRKILITLEDKKLSQELADDLNAAGYKAIADVRFAPENLSAPGREEERDVDIIILDAHAGGSVTKIREDPRTADIPIIGLVVKSKIGDDPLVSLDELLFHPLRAGELFIRIKRLLIKAGGGVDKSRIRFGDLIINLESYEVTIAGKSIGLTYKEFALLRFLAEHPCRVYDRQTLLNQIWEYDYYGGSRTVDVHIRRLRAKLGSKYGSMIQTVRHVGYRFSGD